MKSATWKRAKTNQHHGKSFEAIFETRCRLERFHVTKNGLKALHGVGGKVRLYKSDLDYRLIQAGGRCGFFDCKNYEGSHFTFSQLTLHQIQKAIQYNELGVQAGFVVWLRSPDLVMFYSGVAVLLNGPGSRFDHSNGLLLGKSFDFSLKNIMNSI